MNIICKETNIPQKNQKITKCKLNWKQAQRRKHIHILKQREALERLREEINKTEEFLKYAWDRIKRTQEERLNTKVEQTSEN